MVRLTYLMVLCLMGIPLICWSGSPHFVSCTPVVAGDEVCVTGKEAGLGDESQVDIQLSLVAHCQNRGDNDPAAQNKETFATAGTFPVQNGKALYELCVITDFQPDCHPPMAVIVDAVTLIDEMHGISCSQVSQ